MQSNRTANAARNIFWGYVGTLAAMAATFAVRTVFVHSIGLAYLGLNSLFTSLLSLLSFAELGIGAAMNAGLYGPLARGETRRVRALMAAYRKAYRWVAAAVALLGLALLPFVPLLVTGGGLGNVRLYYTVFLLNTVSSYFVSYRYGLVYAAQQEYLLTNIHSVFRLLTALAQAAALLCFQSFLAYLLAQTALQLAEKLFCAVFVARRFPESSGHGAPPLPKEEKRHLAANVRALVLHKLAGVSVGQTDGVLIFAFLGASAAGLAANYNLIAAAIGGVLGVMFNSITPIFGHFIATESRQKQQGLFEVYSFVGFWLYGCAAVGFFALGQPFITLWLGPAARVSGAALALMALCQYTMGHQVVNYNFKAAAGLFRQGRWLALAQAAVNLAVSLLLVQPLGLPGVYTGTLAQGLLGNLLLPVVVYRAMFAASPGPHLRAYTLRLALVCALAAACKALAAALGAAASPLGFCAALAACLLLYNGVVLGLHFRHPAVRALREKARLLLRRRAA